MGCSSSKPQQSVVAQTVKNESFEENKLQGEGRSKSECETSSQESDVCICRLGRVITTYAGDDEYFNDVAAAPPLMRGALLQYVNPSERRKVFCEVNMGILSIYRDRDRTDVRQFNLSDYFIEEVELNKDESPVMRLKSKRDSDASNYGCSQGCDCALVYVRKEKEKERDAWLYCLKVHQRFS